MPRKKMTLKPVKRLFGLAPIASCVMLLAPMCVLAQDAAGVAEDEELAEIVLPGSISSTAPEGYYDDLDDAADPRNAPPPLSATDRLQNLFKLYRDAVGDNMFAEADTLAKQIVELTIEIHGLDNSATARAITNLAIAQYGAEDFEAAALNFQSAIDITERISDRLNDDLINPLKGLAATQLAMGKPRLATDNYQRARHISHVNFGPHNLEQVETLESLVETYLAVGDIDEAVELQERIFMLQTRNIPVYSEDMLPALHNQARWQHRLGLFDQERYTWRRMINILQDSRGGEDLSLISPLTGLGMSYLFIVIDDSNYGMPPSVATGEIYLKRAMRIAERNSDAEWTHLTDTKIALADFYVLTGKTARAARLYREAWEIFSADEARVAQRAATLESLAVIQNVAPPRVFGAANSTIPARRPEGFESGAYLFEYTVSTRGTPTNIELIEAEPAGLDEMERDVVRELRRIMHRPRIVDGDTVSTDRVRFAHSFYYRPGDVPEDEEASSEATESR